MKRELLDLGSVGPATVRDLKILGITSVAQLVRADAHDLYARLCAVTGERHDICCLDVFQAAIAQARDPLLPEEQRRWWYWSRVRLRGADATASRPARDRVLKA